MTADKFRLKYNYKTVLVYGALFLGMLFLNFTMSGFEPFSLALLAAALVCGANPVAAAGSFILAGGLGFAVSALPFAVIAAQGVFLGAVFMLYRRGGRTMKKEAALYLLAACLLFFWVFGQYVYFSFAKAAIVAACIYILCFVFIGAMRCLLWRAGKRRLACEDLIFCAAAAAAAGIGLYNGIGEYAYEGIALFLILLCAAAQGNGNAALCALVLALPAGICQSAAAAAPALTDCALYVLYAAVAVVFMRIGKLPAALAVFFANVTARYFTDFFNAADLSAAFTGSAFYLTMLVPLIPCALFALLPEFLLRKLRHVLHRYGDKSLTRAGINRSRAVIGEKLFEVSAVFREIENIFADTQTERESETGVRAYMLDGLRKEVCTACERRNECGRDTEEGLARLIAVGCGKGRVNLIDLPASVTAHCGEPSALIFSLNKMLAEYRQSSIEAENRTIGRKLLAGQARAVADMLKKLAVEQCSPLSSRRDAETAVKTALARGGIPCDEALISGDPPEVLLTLSENANGENVCRAASAALGMQFALSKKREISAGKYVFLLRRRPDLDAAFGVASRTKDGETMCGDTHSMIKIDERTFLFALSDGMGSGEYARSVSDSALSLIESFCRAGLTGESMLETVNELLAFRRDELFACVDIATVNLDTGRTDIVKIGSPLGFLLTENGTEILESDSLPLGILEGVRPTSLTRSLGEGDILIFLSDGITSAFGSSADLAEFLSALRTSNPQAIADELLAGALQRTGGAAPDDMTVVAMRLFASAGVSENKN